MTSMDWKSMSPKERLAQLRLLRGAGAAQENKGMSLPPSPASGIQSPMQPLLSPLAIAAAAAAPKQATKRKREEDPSLVVVGSRSKYALSKMTDEQLHKRIRLLDDATARNDQFLEDEVIEEAVFEARMEHVIYEHDMAVGELRSRQAQARKKVKREAAAAGQVLVSEDSVSGPALEMPKGKLFAEGKGTNASFVKTVAGLEAHFLEEKQRKGFKELTEALEKDERVRQLKAFSQKLGYGMGDGKTDDGRYWSEASEREQKRQAQRQAKKEDKDGAAPAVKAEPAVKQEPGTLGLADDDEIVIVSDDEEEEDGEDEEMELESDESEPEDSI